MRKNLSKKHVLSALVQKLTRGQLFWLCVFLLAALCLIGICAPTALIGIFSVC